jgi:hypothetical protein
MAENLTLDTQDGEPLPFDPSANPRDAVEDALAAKRSKEHQTLPDLDGLNAQSAGDEPEQDDHEAKAGTSNEDPPRDESGRFSAREPKPENDDGSSGETRKIKLKVNGQELELTEAEVIARAQKAEAADRRFADAAAMMREAQQLSQNRQPPQQPKEQSTPNPDDWRASVKKALMYGTEEDVDSALETLVSQAKGTSIDPRAIVAQTAEMVAERTEYQTALNSALEEFPEVRSDQRLQEVATSFVMDALAEDLMGLGYTQQQLAAAPRDQWWQRHREARKSGYSVRGYRELFSAAGTRTREWRSGGQTQAQDGLADKLDRKASASPQPRAARAATPARGEPKPKTQGEVIAEERKARGLPNY